MQSPISSAANSPQRAFDSSDLQLPLHPHPSLKKFQSVITKSSQKHVVSDSAIFVDSATTIPRSAGGVSDFIF